MRVSISRVSYLVALLLVLSYALFALRGPKGIPALMAKEDQIRDVEKINTKLAQENERLRERIQRLNDNPADQELEIRQRLKLVHPGEKIFIFSK
jgi:cell division protein FtsB